MGIYYTYDGKTYHKYYSYDQLINWIAQHDIPYVGTAWENGFLRHCGNNSNDTVTFRDWRTGVTIHDQRNYRIYDEDWHSIFNGGIVADVREATYNATMEEDRQRKERADKEWCNELERAGYLRSRRRHSWFNMHPKCHSWGHYSNGASPRDLRYAADPEHAPYIRPNRNLTHLPDCWDDKFNRCSAGWKNSTKCRHQWEPKARREAKRISSSLLLHYDNNYSIIVIERWVMTCEMGNLFPEKFPSRTFKTGRRQCYDR